MKPLHNQLVLAFDGVVLTVGEWIALNNQQYHGEKVKAEEYAREDLRTPDKEPPAEDEEEG